MNVFYFLGTVAHHIVHARSLYEQMGGEFIVLNQECADACIAEGFNYKFLDTYPDKKEYIDEDEIWNTLIYLQEQSGVIFFFHPYTIIPEIQSLTSIMLFHGNGIKPGWLTHRRINVLNQFDYMTSLGPYMESALLYRGIKAESILQIGEIKSDYVIENCKTVQNQNLIFDKMPVSGKPIISYMPTWWPNYSVREIGKEIVSNISSDYVLIFRPHPDTPATLIAEYEAIIDTMDNVIYIPEYKYPDIKLTTILQVSDAFISDMGSIVTNMLLTEKPIIFSTYQSQVGKYSPIQEVFDASQYLNMANMADLNTIIATALGSSVPAEDLDAVIQSMSYHYTGGATAALVDFATGIIESGSSSSSSSGS